MSTVNIKLGVAPALDPGSPKNRSTNPSSLYCGEEEHAISTGSYSNGFKYVFEERKTDPVFEDSKKTNRTGGNSLNLNLEGSLISSIGKDSSDQKSILLDTAGSLVAWFGKDRNDRSVVMQTDGSVAVNVGGYNGETFNEGRLDIRVNVTDKGIVGDAGVGYSEGGRSMPFDSDYIISIGAHGLLISGTTVNDMLIRNKGDIAIESSEGKVILAGFEGVYHKQKMDQLKDLSFDPTEKPSRGAEDLFS